MAGQLREPLEEPVFRCPQNHLIRRNIRHEVFYIQGLLSFPIRTFQRITFLTGCIARQYECRLLDCLTFQSQPHLPDRRDTPLDSRDLN
jgi:hypothetical protein